MIKKIPMVLVLLAMIAIVFSGCFVDNRIKLIEDASAVATVRIKQSDKSFSYEITDSEDLNLFFSTFKDYRLDKKKKDNALLETVPNQGNPEYELFLIFEDATLNYSFTINFLYPGNDSTQEPTAYYVQWRETTQRVFYAEITETVKDVAIAIYFNYAL